MVTIPYHVHTFVIPDATLAEFIAGSTDEKAVTPASVPASLRSIVGLTTAADRMIYTTAADTYAVTTLTAAGRAILDDATASDQRTTLGVAIGSDVQTYSANLDTLSGVTPGATGLALLDDATAAAARTTIGTVIGTDVQAWNTNLDTLAGITPGTAGQAILADAAIADVRDYLDAPPYVADRTALKALDTSKDTTAFFDGSLWDWDSSDLSTEVGVDPGEAMYASSGDGSSGAWRRRFNGIVWSEWFNLTGDFVADDTEGLTAFWNHAKNNPGVVHYLSPPPTAYWIDAALPSITEDDVQIWGAGAAIHDVGNLVTGSVIKWGGATAASTAMAAVSAVSGASNQRVTNVCLRGIGFDCNSGAAGYGLTVDSAYKCEFDVAVANARTQGILVGVVATLGEARDTQRCKFDLRLRQLEYVQAGLYLNGDSGANTSLNEFWVDGQHSNTPLVICANSDNNNWNMVRISRSGGGTATESMQLLGGATTAQRSRAERIFYFVATVGLRAYGTGTYTVGSEDHSIFCIDADNGTPAPTVDAGASVNWRYDNTPMEENAWVSYTPTISAKTGTLTTVDNINGEYRHIGKMVEIKIEFRVVNHGTGSVALEATTPVDVAGSSGHSFAGVERGVTGNTLSVFVDTGASQNIVIKKYDGTYHNSANGIYVVTGTYQAA